MNKKVLWVAVSSFLMERRFKDLVKARLMREVREGRLRFLTIILMELKQGVRPNWT